MTHWSDLVYAVLLILAISFVYSAGRIEPIKDVLVSGLKMSCWFFVILLLFVIVMCILF